MDFHKQVFQAAEKGDLPGLKVLLGKVSGKMKDSLSSTITAEGVKNAAPLLTACKNGRFDVVEFLLEECHAEVEERGPISIGKELIEGATPLWCAASNGNIKLCKLLIKHNASVNGVTETNSTPLRAACFKGHTEIVRYFIEQGADIEIANKHNHTCLMIACFQGHCDIVYHLLKSGAAVNRKSLKGTTVLHDCAHSGSLDILKMLLDHGANYECDFSGISPIIYAASRCQRLVVNYMIELLTLTKLDKINAFELLGAVFMFNFQDTNKARWYWKHAMEMRFEDEACPILKPPPSILENYIGHYEPRTLLQLGYHYDLDPMKLDSVLIKERILGPGVPENISLIIALGEKYMETGMFGRSLQLLQYAFDIDQELEFCYRFTTNLEAFMGAFTTMFLRSSTVIPASSFQTLLHIFEITLKVIENALKQYEDPIKCFSDGMFHIMIILTLRAIGFMCQLKSHASGYNETELKAAVYKFVSINARSKEGMTPLHVAISDVHASLHIYPQQRFPLFETVDLLLQVGACPNAMDQNQNTPLHIVAMSSIPRSDVFMLLLKYKAHLDFRNNERKTPLQLAQNLILPDLCPLQYTNLQCLCAKTIKDFKIPYAELVSKQMEIFVNKH